MKRCDERDSQALPGAGIAAILERGIYGPTIEDKLAAADLAEQWLVAPEQPVDFGGDPRPATEAQFPANPPLVDFRELPQRGLKSTEGRVAFLHAIAHIEFTAIVLAFDMAYRFRDMPADFYHDWVGVAVEEARHFRALNDRLADFGAAYGDLPAHRGLWDLAEDTAHDLLARLALVPRFMEARGLDVTPAMIVKLEQAGDGASADILRMILREEIGHVALGSRWFRHVCELGGREVEPTYFELLEQYLKSSVRGPFNREARIAAGFGENELERLQAMDGRRDRT